MSEQHTANAIVQLIKAGTITLPATLVIPYSGRSFKAEGSATKFTIAEEGDSHLPKLKPEDFEKVFRVKSFTVAESKAKAPEQQAQG